MGKLYRIDEAELDLFGGTKNDIALRVLLPKLERDDILFAIGDTIWIGGGIIYSKVIHLRTSRLGWILVGDLWHKTLIKEYRGEK